MQSNNCERIREEKVSTKRGHESSCDSLNKRAGRITGRDYCSNRTPDDMDCFKGSTRERRGYRMEGQRRDRSYDLDGRNDRPRSYSWDRRKEEWNCLECQFLNSPNHTSCKKCSCPKSDHVFEGRGRAREDCYKNSLDEFGRQKGACVKPSRSQWPPPFERRSASYIFDTRSGMFYHSSTQFFYDPKTKLYYGNKQQKYFVFCRGENPPFKEFKRDDETIEDNPEKNEKVSQVEDRKVIAISLKTKVLHCIEKKEEKKIVNEKRCTGQTAVSKAKKEHNENIDRWSERGREKRGKDQTVRTKDGKPVCLLCKRKFGSIEKLDRHEELSSLHKLNLSKYSQRKNITEDRAEAHYRDRALERRVLHGPDEMGLTKIKRPAEKLVHDYALSAPQENLGESNLGNQMLQKLGWKEGSNIGRNITNDSSKAGLEKEWERIEKLANVERTR